MEKEIRERSKVCADIGTLSGSVTERAVFGAGDVSRFRCGGARDPTNTRHTAARASTARLENISGDILGWEAAEFLHEGLRRI